MRQVKHARPRLSELFSWGGIIAGDITRGVIDSRPIGEDRNETNQVEELGSEGYWNETGCMQMLTMKMLLIKMIQWEVVHQKSIGAEAEAALRPVAMISQRL